MRTIFAFVAAIFPLVSFAQTNPNFQQHQVVTSAQWNNAFSGKADTSGGVLNNPTLSSPTLTGTVAGSPTLTGAPNLSGGMTIGSAMITLPPGNGSDVTPLLATDAASLTSGGTIVFPSGNYVVSGVTELLSNTRIRCEKASTITAAPSASWPASTVSSAFEATSGSNFEISGCHFSWPLVPGQTSHILNFVGVSNLNVTNNISNGGGDFLAVIGSTNTWARDNTATNVTNGCYDHWGGFTDVHVIGNYCSTLSTAAGGVAGIAFTGIATGGGVATSIGYEAVGNTIYINNNDAQGININGHASGGTDDHGRIIGNKIVVQSGARAWGILVVGHANNIEISDNVCSGNASAYSCVGAFTPATGVSVHDNTATNWQGGSNGIYANTSVGGTLHDNMAYGSSSPLLGSIASTVTSYGNDTGTGAINLSNVNITSGSAALNGTFSSINSPTFGWNGAGGVQGVINNGPGFVTGWRWKTAGVNHWFLGLDGTAQSGSNAGDNFIISSQSDTGTQLANPLTIPRASGHFIYASVGTTAVGSGSSDCGTTPAIAGNDNIGRITVGSSTNGGKCTITFANPWTNAPVCSVSDETTATPVHPVSTTTTMAITGTLTAADKLVYQCAGY